MEKGMIMVVIVVLDEKCDGNEADIWMGEKRFVSPTLFNRLNTSSPPSPSNHTKSSLKPLQPFQNP